MIKKYVEDGWEIQLAIDYSSLDKKGTVEFGLSIKPLPDGKMYGDTGRISAAEAQQISDDPDYLKTMLQFLKTSYPHK